MKSRRFAGLARLICLCGGTLLAVSCTPAPSGGGGGGNTEGTGGRSGSGGGGGSPSGTGGTPSGSGGNPSGSGGAPAGTGGSSMPSGSGGGSPGTGGTTPAGTGGSAGTPDAGGTPDSGGPAAGGVELTGKVAKTVFKITVTNRVGDGRSGTIATEQENQKNEDVFKGAAGKTYDVTFRVRGLVEPRIYEGGAADPASPWIQIGGMASNANREHGVQYGQFRIEVSEPKQVYFLNKDQNLKDHELYKLDYKIKVKVAGGATVSMVFFDRPKSGAITNHKNMVVDGIPADVVMQPFKDQFMLIEADEVVAAP